MEFVVRKNDLLRELQLFQGIVERKNTIPILANVLVEAAGEELKFLATDLEVGLRTQCAAAVSRGGALTIPAKKFYEIVKALPESDVQIEKLDNNWVSVLSERFQSKIPSLPREDFPSLPDGGGARSVVLPRKQLRQMVERTAFAITGEDTRYFLNGALFVLRPDAMTLVATDGHRLAMVTAPRESQGRAPAEELRVIIPKKTLWELARLLTDQEGDVRFELGENHIFFGLSERLLISRMIDGQFPAYERVVPKGNDKRIEFERERITGAMRRVALLSNERSRAVRFQIAPGSVEVRSSSPEFGEASETIPIEYDGEGFQICFNAQYVMDFLSVVDTDTVAFELKDEMSQALLRPVGVEEYDYQYVIMPMRI